MSFTTDAVPNASIPPSEMPDATNPNPQKKDSTLKTVLIVLAVIFGLQFVLPMIFLVFFIIAIGPNFEEFMDDLIGDYSYEVDGGYSNYGGIWKLSDSEECISLGSDNEFMWVDNCEDMYDNYASGNYTVKNAIEAEEDLALDTGEILSIVGLDRNYYSSSDLYSFHFFVRSEKRNGELNDVANEELHMMFYNLGRTAVLYNMDDGLRYDLEYYIPATNYEDDSIPDPQIDLPGDVNSTTNRT